VYLVRHRDYVFVVPFVRGPSDDEITLKKDRRMNVRISERDLKGLKVRAAEEGIPYQTLVTMVLHKYVTGRLVEKQPAG
jgi:hypothetical protein